MKANPIGNSWTVDFQRSCSYEAKWIDIAGTLTSVPGVYCRNDGSPFWKTPNDFTSWVWRNGVYPVRNGCPDPAGANFKQYSKAACPVPPPPVCCPGGQTYYVVFDGSLSALGLVPLLWRYIPSDHYSGTIPVSICGAGFAQIDLQCHSGLYELTVSLYDPTMFFLFEYRFGVASSPCDDFLLDFTAITPSPHPFFHCTDPTYALVTD
jgi:hypothetical protein